MKRIFVMLCLLSVAGCASTGASSVKQSIDAEMDVVAKERALPSKQDEVNNALLPPLAMPLQAADGKMVAEAKFDLVVNNTPAQQVFMAIVSGTRYSMLLHPDVGGNISLNLKDVTVFDALESIREMYGYEYKMDGARIYIQPVGLQTRIFQVSYLTGQRDGKSNLRVSSGSVGDVTSGSTGTTANTPASGASSSDRESSKVSMTSKSNFWEELSAALVAIVGAEKGRSVVISPMSGVIVVRAMPEELRNIAAYLKASQISIERQVILEAKIVEVQLNETFQSGVNWGVFGSLKNSPGSLGSFGVVSPGATLGTTGSMTNGIITSTAGTNLAGVAAGSLPSGATAGTLFGLAFQTGNFAAMLNFLETQGDVHVLSSPRIATLNNQKAILKVGTDEFFVTEISGGTQSTTAIAGTSPTVKVQPFFSGIMLDVTPRIDENDEIILHVHPSVSTVSTVNKTVNLGVSMGTYNLPLASSSVSETDSVVRARDGQIVAIGGLMRQASFDDQSGIPGLSKNIFGQTSRITQKRELVILIKPTVVNSDKDWSDDITRSRDRISGMNR
jgi:MSHA biogenesis protein MshL